MSRLLNVFLHNRLTGHLTQNDRGGLSFQYDEAYLTDRPQPLSISLPLQTEIFEGDIVRAFFSGLLPDDIVKHRLARFLGLSEKNPFALLEAIGGECAGALSLQIPKSQQIMGEPIDLGEDGDVEVLDSQKLKEILDLLKRRPLLAGEDGLRLSLAGAQDKLAVGLVSGKIALMRGNRPTTHILKPLIEGITDSVHNELFCMRLAKLIGIDVPYAQIIYVEDTPCYLVDRYDRIERNGKTVRVHQEDFCQALGILPDVKYEREGGPSLAQCMDILKRYSQQPASDILKLQDRVIFNFLIGNSDAHGKNFSLIYRGSKPQLAPAYDMLSTAIYPNLAVKMAMKIGGQYEPEGVHLRHWQKLVADTTAAKRGFEKKLLSLSDRTLENAEKLERKLHQQGIDAKIYAEILDVIGRRAKHIKGSISGEF
jgi:serine/threonine-protein kinase HipA